ncbi:intracellular protein transporter [Rhynchospora pubera]|uniref:Intracellular protein transporter n=1 Tax=Rhynchospora pubera TaxID=906938 RepID=A0AAV8DUM2_9POAL|nr:intracellular protein transporter [Rhynchospora pubera]
MTLKHNRSILREKKSNSDLQVEGPNWVFIAGGVLLSTFTFRLGCKLKHVFDRKQQNTPIKANRKVNFQMGQGGTCKLHSNLHCCTLGSDKCCFSISGYGPDVQQAPSTSLEKETSLNQDPVMVPNPHSALSLIKFQSGVLPNNGVGIENGIDNEGVMWTTSPDRLEPPRKQHQYSNSSGSPCFSESGSDIYSKKDVIQKLRLQLKRRDEMVMEMQSQISELQNSLNIQLALNSNLQSQLESANQDLFESDREIRRLQKVVVDRCVMGSSGMVNGNGFYADNGVEEVDGRYAMMEKRMESLKKEVRELREVIEGKEFLIQNYKEQKVELHGKVKELQAKLAASEVTNILHERFLD